MTIACVGHPGSLEREDSVCPTWGDLQPTVERVQLGPRPSDGTVRPGGHGGARAGAFHTRSFLRATDRWLTTVQSPGQAWRPGLRELSAGSRERSRGGQVRAGCSPRGQSACTWRRSALGDPGPRSSLCDPACPFTPAATPVRWGEQLPPARTQGVTLAKCRPLLPFSGRRVFRAICHLEMALRPLPRRPQVSEQEENWVYMAPDLLIFPFQPENTPKVCK